MKPKLVDLFCGIGIGSIGFMNAGFEVVGAVDIDPAACAVYKENLGFEPVVGDLRRIHGADILERAGLRRGELDLCSGCPPCQAFSTLRQTRLVQGRRRRKKRDGRKSLLRVFGQRIEEMLPKAFVLENVRGLTLNNNKRFLYEFRAHMERVGYSCVHDVLDAADYGVPQHRWRFMMIGSRVRPPTLPERTHSAHSPHDGRLPWRTVREAIGELPSLNSGEGIDEDPLHQAAAHSEPVLEIIRHIPHDGGSRRSLPRNLWLPCHKRLERLHQRGAESIYGRMRWNTPSPTITTRFHTPSCGRFVHPSQDRGITAREAARLQSIPDSFRITGSKDQTAMWIGNAFPLLLAEQVAEHALSSI